jgi:F-type H+-transporting ATPase subunit epsilon
MAETTEFELLSPEKRVLLEATEMAVLPGTEGDIGAMPHHSLLITGLRPGVVSLYRDGRVGTRLFVAGGFAEITATRVTVLAEEAILLSDLSVELAQSRLAAAEAEALAADSDHARSKAARALAIAKAMQSAQG